ncbi:hypothetical protein [Pacificibacter marinus]|uniref:Cation transport ATPase n=1 Tax=Pacificibacter marinus TaxID=658057 RepID=A0A1Y5S2X0_9RHOB|nr:hypothetical protein [Pacificibacter marinus]SEK91893.1 hypothetical protein SAMN04488032_108107 [Pacificibacter marinus]SLN31453.1 hypothetical protein PAM7971_01201 [Pacificibacter marinus]
MVRKKLSLALLALAGLCGCQMAMPQFGSNSKTTPPSVLLSSSGLIVTAPQGFCIDAASLKDTPDIGFVLMADCAALRGKKKPSDAARSVMVTAALSGPLDSPESVTSAALDSFFATTQGRSTLSRSGDPDTVSATSEILPDDILVLHARDSSPATIKGLAGDDWRAFTVISGRLVTLTAAPFANMPAPNPSAKALVTELARRLKVENAPQ